LTVTDFGGLQSTANCSVYVTPEINEPPIADAGENQVVDEGITVILDGSNSSDPDGDIVSYQWTQISGTSVTLSDPTSAQPTFTAPGVGPDGDMLTFSLTVTDNGGMQGTNTCNITVNSSPGNVQPGQVTLEWSPNSEPDLAGYSVYSREESQSYDYDNPYWEGTDTTCTIYDLDETKTYCFVARAYDTEGFESGDSNEVCFEPGTTDNQPPISDAGPDQTVNEGQLVTLDGSNSTDPDDGIASYLWTQVDGDPVTLSDPTSNVTTFTAPESGQDGSNLTFQLTVTDFGGLQSTANCSVYVTPEINEPPIADAGEDQIVEEGAVVILDGSNSSDPDGEIASYQWTQISGTTVTLAGPTSALPTFIAPDVGLDGDILTFSLTLTDNGGMQGTDTCYVTVSSEIQTDNVTITSATYNTKRKKLMIKAVSDAPAGSVTLTAFANYGTESVKLGNLRYSAWKKVYSKTLRRIYSAPDTVTVTSSGGGSDNLQCIIN